jgi:hypothetical protein
MRHLYFTLFAWGLLISTARADGSRIIRPDPADFSHISDFRPEWCASRLCFGRALFQKLTRVRAILVKDGSAGQLYVEDDFPKVELLKPRFGVVGPVATPGFRSEMGMAQVTIDARGEVDSVSLQTPSFGTLFGARP